MLRLIGVVARPRLAKQASAKLSVNFQERYAVTSFFRKCFIPFAFLAGINAAGQSSVQRNGPFGFYFGETRAAILLSIPKAAVKAQKDDRIILLTAPKPHPEFEEYVLTISPAKGLLNIRAIGKTIQNDSYGTTIRDHFSDMAQALSGQYGDPTDHYDFLNVGSIWTEDREFMMGLTKEERNLNDYWKVPGKYDLSIIALDAKGLNSSDGYLELTYEFKGWEDYLDSRKAKQGSVL